MIENDRPFLAAALLWGVLCASVLLWRPPLPIDETRYLSVAWEMWRTHGFLVPRLNGAPYPDKPPLLFHLIHAGWFLFGVRAWSARLTAPAVGFADLVLTAGMARLLWPERRATARLVPLVLLAFPLWAVFGTMTMFDTLLAFFVLLAAMGLQIASRDEGAGWGWVLCAAALGGGVLSKGPVVFLHVLPVALLAPLWREDRGTARWGRWYAGLAGAVAGGAAIALLWALPAAREGGEAYGRAILWGQTAGRTVGAFAHGRPVWWYLPILPLLLFPWGMRPGMWRAVMRDRGDPGIRFCLAWSLPVLFLLSLVSGKQIHYLLPILPAAALLAARTTHSDPGSIPDRFHWGTAAFCGVIGAALPVLPHIGLRSPDLPPLGALPTIPLLLPLLPAPLLFLVRPHGTASGVRTTAAGITAFLVLLHAGPVRELAPAFDLKDTAGQIARIQEAGGAVGVWPAKYAGQFGFAGRLVAPLTPLTSREALEEWMGTRGHGALVVTRDLDDGLPGWTPARPRRFRGGWLLPYPPATRDVADPSIRGGHP